MMMIGAIGASMSGCGKIETTNTDTTPGSEMPAESETTSTEPAASVFAIAHD